MGSKHDLDQTFIHKTTTHEYCIRWTRAGNPTLPALVFIHGTPWRSGEWHALAETLSPYYSIYLYDHPGFGISPQYKRLSHTADHAEIDIDGSLVLRAEASAALFKHWNLTSPPHIIAHDNGGLVSLRLLLQLNIKFASLCLIDVVAIGPFGLPFFKLVAENEAVFTAIPPPLIEGFVRGYVRSATHKPLSKEVEDTLSAPWLTEGTQGPKRFLGEMIQAHNRDTTGLESEYPRAGALTPIKIIWGQKDAWIPVETAQRLKDALHAEELVTIEEAGHLVQYDQPGRIAFEVGVWLTEKSKDKR